MDCIHRISLASCQECSKEAETALAEIRALLPELKKARNKAKGNERFGLYHLVGATEKLLRDMAPTA